MEPSDQGPSPDVVEELSPAEVVFSLKDFLQELRARRGALEQMPHGPRKQADRGTYRRRVRFVDLPLQLSYVGVYVATVTLLAVGFVALNFMFKALYDHALTVQQAGVQDSPELLLLGLVNMSFVLILVVGMAVYAVIQSHRVAGPTYRFGKALEQIQKRDYDWHLQLRRKDYLQELAEQVNQLNLALKAKDLVVAGTAVRLGELAQASDEVLAPRLEEAALELGELVLANAEHSPQVAGQADS